MKDEKAALAQHQTRAPRVEGGGGQSPAGRRRACLLHTRTLTVVGFVRGLPYPPQRMMDIRRRWPRGRAQRRRRRQAEGKGMGGSPAKTLEPSERVLPRCRVHSGSEAAKRELLPPPPPRTNPVHNNEQDLNNLVIHSQ